MPLLFAYGSLLDPEVQRDLFGKTLPEADTAILKGWEKCTEEEYPYIRPNNGCRVQGSLLQLSPAELEMADGWEEVPEAYQRELLWVEDNDKTLKAWVYTRR